MNLNEENEHLKNLAIYKAQLEDISDILRGGGGEEPTKRNASSSKVNNLKKVLENLITINQKIIEQMIVDNIQWRKSFTLQHYKLFSSKNLQHYVSNPYLSFPIQNVRWPQESTLSKNQ
jgi:hypothetical protein